MVVAQEVDSPLNPLDNQFTNTNLLMENKLIDANNKQPNANILKNGTDNYLLNKLNMQAVSGNAVAAASTTAVGASTPIAKTPSPIIAQNQNSSQPLSLYPHLNPNNPNNLALNHQWLNFNQPQAASMAPGGQVSLVQSQQPQPPVQVTSASQIELLNTFIANNQFNLPPLVQLQPFQQQQHQQQAAIHPGPINQANFLPFQNQMGLNQFALNNLSNLNQYQIDLIDNFKNVI